METLTPNYHLRKQDENEFYSETINSDNMVIIDVELKKSADHAADNENPHAVTKSQVGLGNVDDTADADKPISTATAGELSKLKTFQTATGTANAIALTGVELIDGFQTTFIILASNSGATTTINAKPLYKPGTTTAPKLVAGKAATIWYNSAGDCFFIKASADGTATAVDVLAGKTFSNDDDTGLTGTMANRGAVTITPSTTNQTILSGYHNGSGYVAGDADLATANILAGINTFGVTGSAKRKASGSVSFSNYSNSLTISNLTFTPSLVCIMSGDGVSTGFAIYMKSWADMMGGLYYINGRMNSSSSLIPFSDDGSYVNATGFKFSFSSSSQSGQNRWIAIE